MSLFDTVHTISYSTVAKTMRLSCTVFELQRVICQKLPFLRTYRTCIWRPRSGYPVRNSPRSWVSENYNTWAIVWRFFQDSTLAILTQYRRVSDGQRERQTDTRRHLYRASIASHDKTRAPAIAEKPRDSFMSVEMLADVWLTQQITST